MQPLDVLSNIRVKDIHQVIFNFPTKPNRNTYTREHVVGLVFVISGEIHFTYDDKHFKVKSGQAILLTGDKTYSYYRDKPARIMLINFVPWDNLGSEDFIVFNIRDMSKYIPDFQAMYNLTPFDMAYKKNAFLSVFYNLLARIVRSETHKHPAIEKAIEYINKNISNPDLDLVDVAKYSCYSEGYLRKRFTEQFDMSPIQYIQNQRLNLAETLLNNENLSIKEISEECGYASQFYFSRAFKKRTGYPPSEYRRRYSKFV